MSLLTNATEHNTMTFNDLIEGHANTKAHAVTLVLRAYRAHGFNKQTGLAVEWLNHIDKGPRHAAAFLAYCTPAERVDLRDTTVEPARVAETVSHLVSGYDALVTDPIFVRALNGVCLYAHCARWVMTPESCEYLLNNYKPPGDKVYG